jgi:hypothetical protein
MTKVAIQPAASADAQKHYASTVASRIKISDYRSEAGVDLELLTRVSKDGEVALWGVTAGKRGVNAKKYQKLSVGDVVLFTKEKHVFSSGRITALIQNPRLAKAVWDIDDSGETWEYMYALDDVRPQRIPYSVLSQAIGSSLGDNYMGFRPLDPTKSRAALGLLGIEDAAAEWTIAIGQEVKRTELHDEYGGAGRGGIEPSAKTPNILIFTNPEKGKKYGYDFDRELEDGTFEYTGDGQVGDQDPHAGGNKTILEHRKTLRSLRLFEATKVKGFVRYLGEYELGSPPYEMRTGVDEAGLARELVVFHLMPVGATKSAQQPSYLEVPLGPIRAKAEVNLADEHSRKSSGAATVARRYEAKLQKRYEDYLRAKGIDVDRLIIPIALTKVQLKVDLANFTEKVLIEVKAGTSRLYVREAIGQVLDYMYQLNQSTGWQGWRPAILLPGRPSEDLVGLIASLNILLIYEDAEGSFK